MNKILVTGAAGFIGFHLVSRLIESNYYDIVGLDIINDYYNPKLKLSRLVEHGIETSEIEINKIVNSKKHKHYKFVKSDIQDCEYIKKLFSENKFDIVINLAAQAGVRYSIENPRVYINSNVDGFLSILEGCKICNVKHLIYASTSSVYGLNSSMPLSERQPTEHPISLYAATKKANELMAHVYSHLFDIPTTGLRFFTVYGPWGRPDMALYLFAQAILKNEPISLFNNGNMIRDFTYVSDVVESIYLLIPKPPIRNSDWDTILPNSFDSSAPYQIFNVGNSSPVNLIDYINSLEKHLNKKAVKNYKEIQPGDVPITHADAKYLEQHINFKPSTSIDCGIKNFVSWYLKYNDIVSK